MPQVARPHTLMQPALAGRVSHFFYSNGVRPAQDSTTQAAACVASQPNPRRQALSASCSNRSRSSRVCRGFVGEGTEPAAEYHSSDFDWHELEEAGRAALAEQRRQRQAGLEQQAGQRHAEQEEREGQAQPQQAVPGRHAGGPRAGEGAAWEGFHSMHSRARFFKEKRYLLLEFPQLAVADPPQHIAEIGCGCGSSVLPVLKANPTARVTACDVSPTALELLAEAAAKAGVDPGRLSTFVLDASIPPGGSSGAGHSGCSNNGSGSSGGGSPLAGLRADCLLLIFTLSALAPRDMPAMFAHALAGLRPGGLLFVRDYGLYDMAQLRFPGSQMLGESLYRRSDGTLAFFFSTQEMRALAEGAGFEAVECEYACVAVHNRKRCSSMRRVFVHGVFRKPE